MSYDSKLNRKIYQPATVMNVVTYSRTDFFIDFWLCRLMTEV